MIKRLLTALLTVTLLLGSLLPVNAEKFTFKKGATSQTVYFRVFDSSSTTGGSLTGLAFNTASLTCYYVRVLGSATAITLATQTVTGAYSSGGFVQVDATNMPGIYRLDLPDAVLATGVDRATVLCKGAANMVPVQVDIELVAYDPQDSVRQGLTALPNAAAGANTGLPVVGTQVPNANAGANGGLPTVDASNAVKLQSGTGANQISLASGLVTVGTNNDKTGYALTSADKLAVLTAASGTADSGSTSTIVDAERTEAAADYWKDSCVLMTSGANLNQLRRVSAFNATTDTLTVDPVFTSAVSTDTYILLRSATCTAANVAGNVTVGGYAAGQNPADYVLVTPANKISTNASNQVVASSVAGNVTGSVGSIATGGITAGSFAAGAIDAAALAANAIGASEIAAGALTPDVYATTGTISAEAGTTLSLSGGVAANNQFNYTHAIQVYAAADNSLQASSCIVNTVNGAPDQVITMEDITAFIAVSDPFDIVPAPACAGLRPTTLGNKADVTATGEVGIDLNNTAGTLDAAEIGADAITAAKIGAGAITASEAPNLDAAVSTRLATTAFDTKIPTAFSFTGANVNANAQVVADKTGYALSSADKLAVLTGASGTADSGTTSTIVDAERTEAASDYWKDSCVLMTSGANINQLRRVSAFNATTDTLTVDPAFTSAVSTDTYILLRSATCTAANIAGNVTVGGYAAGQDPATYVLVTPANKIAANASNQVVASSVQGNVTGSVGSIATGGITAASFSAGAIDAAAIAAGAVTSSEAPNLDAAITTRLASASYTAPDNASITNIKNYLCNGTGTCNAPLNLGVWDRLDGTITSRSSQSSLDLKISTNLTFTGSLVRSQVGGLDANVITAPAIQDGAIGAAETGLPTGTVSAGSANCNGGTNSATVFATSLTQTVTNFWTTTQLITLTSGALSGQTRQISGYTWTGSVGCLTVATAFTGIPADGVSFFIINK